MTKSTTAANAAPKTKAAAKPKGAAPAKSKLVADPDNLSMEAKRAQAAAAAAEEVRYDDGANEVEAEDIVTLNVVKMLISRDNTKTAAEGFEHEVPIYELVHGEGNVEVYDSEAREVTDIDPQTELDRLLRKFGKNGEKAVRAVYGNLNDLGKEIGVPVERASRRNKTSEQAMSVNFDDPGSLDSGRIKVARILPKKPAKR